MKKIITALTFFITVVFSQNSMIFVNTSGNANDTVTVSVEIENTDSFVGFQFDLPLLEQIDYVSGSTSLSGREADHTLVVSIINENILRVFAYSATQALFTGNEGGVCSFQLTLGTVPGNYDLSPEYVVIGNSEAENILTDVINGTVTLQASDIYLPTTVLDYDRVPLLETSDRSFSIENQGNTSLEVSRVYTSFSDFEVLGDTVFSVISGDSRTVTVRFYSNTKGTYNEQVLIESNDPDEPVQSVSLHVIAYAVNELNLNDMFGRSGYISEMTVDIANMEPFVGFSFDLELPDVLIYQAGSITLTERSADHVVNADILENGNVRVVAYSPTNTPFTGNEGDVAALEFLIDGQGGYYSLNFQNPVIGDSTVENILSDHYGGTLEIASPDIYVSSQSIDFGEVSVFDTAAVDLTIGNFGSDTLIVTQMQFFDPYFFSSQDLPITLNPGQDMPVPVFFHNPDEGTSNTTLRLRSNDPDEDPTDISLSAWTFIPNIMSVDSSTIVASDTGWISVSIENNEPFVGFQFDLNIPPVLSYNDDVQLTDRAGDHVVNVFEVDSVTIRVFSYSLQQIEFIGNSGAVVRLKFQADDSAGVYPVDLSDVIIGNANSENIMSSYEGSVINILYPGPVLYPFPVLTMSEDQNTTISYTYFEQYVTDPNTPLENLQWSLESGTVITVDQSESGWTLTPVANWNGETDIVVTVSDGDNSDTEPLNVNVQAVNDAPVLTPISDQEMNVNETLDLELNAADVDGDVLVFNATSDNPNVFPSINDNNLLLQGAADYFGTAVITVSVEDNNGGYDSVLFTLTIYQTTIELSTQYMAGWNLVGLPVDVTDAAVTEVYPSGASGTLYEFSGTYINVDALVPGNGYWLNFPDVGSTIITGLPITSLTVSLSQGWNLISGISAATDVTAISDPSGIIVQGTIYGFTGTYTNASELIPGKGYWINANEDGQIMIASDRVLTKERVFTNHLESSNTLNISNGEHTTTLYFGKEVPEEDRLSYSLPPTFPEMEFDARFTGDMKVIMESGEVELINTDEILSLTYDINIDAGEHMNWVLISGTGEEFILEGTGELTVPTAERFVLNRKPIIPEGFILEQNSPNPFNPITTLRYDLPEDNFVTLSIYDMLGREITQLVNTTQQAGFKSVQWDATDSIGRPVSGGVYLYQIQAGEFVQTKKMVLLK